MHVELRSDKVMVRPSRRLTLLRGGWRDGNEQTPRTIFERPLVIAFDSPVVNGDLNRISVTVELMHQDQGFRCWCEPAELALTGASLVPPCEPGGTLDPTNNPAAEVNALVIQLSPGEVLRSGGWVRIRINGDLIRGLRWAEAFVRERVKHELVDVAASSGARERLVGTEARLAGAGRRRRHRAGGQLCGQ